MAKTLKSYAGQNVLQYIVAISGKVATLTPTREWTGSPSGVITALGAQTAARLAVLNGSSLQTVYRLRDGLETPEIVVPTAILRLSNLKYRIADDGEAMVVRKATQAANAAFDRTAGNMLRKHGLKFGN